MSIKEPILSLREVAIQFKGGVRAVDGASFDMAQGTMLALLGANGAGKTSLLRSLIGLHHPASGTILFAGESLNALAPHETISKGLSLVPEGRRIYPSLTVMENLKCGFWSDSRRKARGAQEQARMDRVLDVFPDLSTRLSQTGGSLSGGQQQMLAIGRGLMSAPKLLLLDEPSLGVAPNVVAQIYETLRKLRDDGSSILLVEQYASLALKSSDHAVLLAAGRIVAQGSPSEMAGTTAVQDVYLSGGVGEIETQTITSTTV